MEDVSIGSLAWRNDPVAAMAEEYCDLTEDNSGWPADHADAVEQAQGRQSAADTAAHVVERWIGKSFYGWLAGQDRADG